MFGLPEGCIESKYATYGKEWRENIYSLVAKGLINRIDDLAGNINATDDIVEMIKSEAIDHQDWMTILEEKNCMLLNKQFFVTLQRIPQCKLN